MAEYSILGKRTPKADAIPKVTGEAKYAMDVILPGMLYGKVLYSSYSHARILNIDTTKAGRLPGVKAIITGKDTPVKPAWVFPLGPRPKHMDTYILTADKARYIGDAIAAVAAVDEDTAEEALDLIEVEYEILPVIVDPEEAIRPDAVNIHDFAEQNIFDTKVDGYGDVEKGFQESDYVRKDTFKFSDAAYMHPEPQGAVASYDATSGRFTLWTGSAWAYPFRSTLAGMLDIPYHRIKVITPYIGGSFGGRGSWVYPSQLCAALLSRKATRPVRIVNTREEEFIHRWGYHQKTVTIKTGVKKDGTAVAREATVTYDIGAYSGMEHFGSIMNAVFFDAPLTVPNLKTKLVAVYTNKPPHGPFRSYGNYDLIQSCDLQMELIAKDLGIDSMDIKMKNFVQPYSKTHFGWDLKSSGLNECIQKVEKTIDWEKQGEKLPAGRGKGIAASMSVSPQAGMPTNPITADVIVNSDGTVDLFTLGTDSGSGQYCAMRMIVAEELGIPLENVKRPAVDTDLVLEKEGFSLVTIPLMGRAPQTAASDAKQKIFEVVADKMEANVDDLESKNGRVYVKGSPEKGMPFAEAARISIAEKGPIVGKGAFISPAWERGADHMKYLAGRFGVLGDHSTQTYAVAGAEVEVDRETGHLRILRLVHAFDVGFALNPLAVEGQLEGGAIQSLGAFLTEEALIKDGYILNPSYLSYPMLTALDVPEIIPIIVEIETSPDEGTFGAKESGMGCLGAPGPAVVNAIYNATGVMLKEFPATPERILMALEAKK